MKKISYVLLLLILSISLNVKGATFTETILNDNGGKDVISKKGSVDITQQSPIVNSYKESNFYNKTTKKFHQKKLRVQFIIQVLILLIQHQVITVLIQ